MDSLLEPEDQLLRQQYLTAPWGEIGRTITLSVVSLCGKFLLKVCNKINVINNERFEQYVLDDKGTGKGPLITVSNHTSTLDDPMLLSAMLPWSFYLSEHQHGRTRWSLCAREICYSNTLIGNFFRSGKTLPVERGSGLSQPVMRAVAGELSRGAWVHIFPEGRIYYSGELGPLRWGVGRLFCDAVLKSKEKNVPTVLPFYHSNMGAIMPRGARIPRFGKEVTVVIGEPVELKDMAERCGKGNLEDQQCTWKEITDRIKVALKELEKTVPPNPVQEKHKKLYLRKPKPPTEEATFPEATNQKEHDIAIQN